IYFKDAERRHVIVNKAYERFFGVKRQEVLGKTVEEFIPPDTTKPSRMSDDEVINSKKSLFEEQSWANKRGENRIFETRKFPILDDRGNILAIGGISRDITGRKRSEEQIKASLREKEILLREIHHRVKNNLAVIQSLLRIQARYAGNTEFSRMLEDGQNRIRSMALAHELLYQSENLTYVNMGGYLAKLLNQLIESFSIVGKRIEIKKEIQEVHLGIDTAVPLGFILTELLSNCYQHAFPKSGNGEILVMLRRIGEGQCEFVVKDDGVGIPGDKQYEESSSLGFRLIQIFVNQLNGKSEIVREEGTEFRIIFPLN
ncbi:MAG TPA: histidine kinase dimerization/phosphoacceptor domain -containing protein, partial [Desulfomonilaceae bacterium]|nr:histidine kinase dimerization/phosphoacceptor domain -containing protein [Desulfomonilaceae bacterium]